MDETESERIIDGLEVGARATIGIARTDDRNLLAWMASPKERSWVGLLRHMLMSGVHRSQAFTEEVEMMIEQAIGEALANAVEHGTGDTIYSSARFSVDSLVIEIANSRGGCLPICNHKDCPKYKKMMEASSALAGSAKADELDYDRGRGLLIIHAIMDEVEIGCDSNTVSIKMIKRTGTPAYNYTVDEIPLESIQCSHVKEVGLVVGYPAGMLVGTIPAQHTPLREFLLRMWGRIIGSK